MLRYIKLYIEMISGLQKRYLLLSRLLYFIMDLYFDPGVHAVSLFNKIISIGFMPF